MTSFISLTHNCQLRCNYCYAGEKYAKSISKETLLESIDFIFDYTSDKLEFGFFGGEPLLEWELLQFATEEIEKRAKEKKIELVKTITTNALLLDFKKLIWLREHGFYIVISLDGNEQMHNTHRLYANSQGSFNQVKKAIEQLQEVYVDNEYTINMVVTPKNIGYLYESIIYLHEVLNINNIHIALDYFAQWEEDTQLYSDMYHSIGNYVIQQYQQNKIVTINIIDDKIFSAIENICGACSFGELKIGIAPSGNIYPCERLIGEDIGELSIGTVKYGFDFEKRRKLIAQRGNSNEECKICPLKERCTNSCGCTNYTLTGDISKTNGVVCFFQKLFIEVADMVASTLYKEKNRLFLEKFYC